MKYHYTKSNVDVELLTEQINDSSIETELDYILFESPDMLTVAFVSELSSEEKSTLDNIVENHTGEPMEWYRYLCLDCDEYYSGRFSEAPTKCCNCGSSNITDVVKQDPFIVGAETPDGMKWDWFMEDTIGEVVLARRCDNA